MTLHFARRLFERVAQWSGAASADDRAAGDTAELSEGRGEKREPPNPLDGSPLTYFNLNRGKTIAGHDRFNTGDRGVTRIHVAVTRTGVPRIFAPELRRDLLPSAFFKVETRYAPEKNVTLPGLIDGLVPAYPSDAQSFILMHSTPVYGEKNPL